EKPGVAANEANQSAAAKTSVKSTEELKSQAQAKKSDSVVKVEIDPGKIQNDKQTVTLTLSIEKGFHIYANHIGQENIALPTEVTISGKTTPQAVKISYPPGKLQVDEFLGDHYIYEHKAVIEAVVQRAKGDTGPLKAAIRVQACSEGKEGRCLLPATVEVNIP
ncbi:MAG: protein-disulfide reductase DsbD N-terminal domain-containing protein, partial [Verrucomicrobiae bacterium]|nr:protein-disulfide reductase DsbD N-terminal domain-containing protein [Verrucomicrobiae bacterium]